MIIRMNAALLAWFLAHQPPAPLVCLSKWYDVHPQQKGRAWSAVLRDGTTLPYDDAHKKSFDEQLEHPDIEDMFALRYRGGAIRPVTRENDDPGRVRWEPMFAATYGDDFVSVDFVGHRVQFARKAAPALLRVAARLAGRPELAPFLHQLGGTIVKRKIAGTDRTSAHSWGIAIDIDVSHSDYWRWQKPPGWRNRIPQAIVDAFEAEGFIWGGRWYHYDTMHFEYRPELLDERCY